MKTNVTLKVDSDLLREAKVFAAQQGTSISRLLAEQLEVAIRRERSYEAARRRAEERLEEGYDLGWSRPASRDELYER